MPVGLKQTDESERVSGTLRCDHVKDRIWAGTEDVTRDTELRGQQQLGTRESHFADRNEASSIEELDTRMAARPRFALGWLEGIPIPAALVTPTGEIAAASPALLKLTDTAGAMIGISLLSLLWPESRDLAATLIAQPVARSDSTSEPVAVTLLATGTTHLLHVGMPLGAGRSAMRLAILHPANESSSTHTPQASRSNGSIPAPPMHPEGPLRALGGLPLTALVLADGQVAAVTQRAATLLGMPAEAFEALRVEELVGEAAAAELFPDRAGESSKWQPLALPAYPIRIHGAIRACACCLIPFGRPQVGLLLIESWGGTGVEIPSEHARQSSAGYLIAGVAHEINNPLAFVLPILNEMLEELRARRDSMRGVPVETWISQLEEVHEGVNRIAGVVQNLRAAREVTPDAEPTLINQVIANTVRLASVSLPPSVSIRRDLGLVLPARGNRQRLGQVLLNLILNAAHAIEDEHAASGTIFVRSWSDSRYTWLEVRDDGPGVPEEHQERIFEPFFTTRATGSGLGLAVCRAMIRELGGELALQPVIARGACFRIRLPVWHSSTDAASVAPSPSMSTPPPLKPRRRRVLLVDDDPPVRRALRRMLATHHLVEEAASLQEAFEKAQTSEFDILITDLVMSHGGGPALIERLKQSGSVLADHVIVITGMAPDATPLNYPRITKPCTAEELLIAIEKNAK